MERTGSLNENARRYSITDTISGVVTEYGSFVEATDSVNVSKSAARKAMAVTVLLKIVGYFLLFLLLLFLLMVLLLLFRIVLNTVELIKVVGCLLTVELLNVIFFIYFYFCFSLLICSLGCQGEYQTILSDTLIGTNS
jgi:hypothetical protein